MRVHGPCRILPTTVPHKVGHMRQARDGSIWAALEHPLGRWCARVDGHYFVATDIDDTAAMMSAAIRITNNNGAGIELTLPEKSGPIRVLVLTDDEGGRPNMRTIDDVEVPLTTYMTCDLLRDGGIRCATLSSDADGILNVVPDEGYAVEFTARGNLVCPHCHVRIQLGQMRKHNGPCPRCEHPLPELAIPFVIPPFP